MKRSSKVAYGRYAATKLLARVRYFALMHVPKRVSLTIIGGYHGENTGDWAMGEVLLAEADKVGVAAHRLAMRDALRLGEICSTLVIGGGAVATAESLAPVAAVWSKLRFPVTLVGVDFAANLQDFDSDTLKMCEQATSIGLRHRSQFDRVSKWACNPDTYVHSDIAFSRPLQSQRQRQSKLVALNLLPLFHMLKGRIFHTGSPLETFYRRQGSPLAGSIEAIAEGYVEFIMRSVTRLIEDGYGVVHLPFAPEDDLFARTILPRQVTFHPFTRDLARMERIIASAEFFLPTRFHALVAGIRTLTPFVPLAYSAKSEDLLLEFGIERSSIIDRNTLATGIASLSTVTISEGGLKAAAKSAAGAVSRALAEANEANI